MKPIENKIHDPPREIRREANYPTTLSANKLGLSIGLTGVLIYAGCILTMSTVPRDQAVMFFNSLLHGIDVDPILRKSMPLREVVLGILTTFALGWIGGVLISGFYKLLGGGKEG